LFRGYSAPANPPTFFDLPGDKINFFLFPGGVSTEPFYRVLFSPNPTTNVCDVWSQASLFTTTDANVGTSWISGGNVAFTFNGGQLTIEYRIPWSGFNVLGMEAATAPAQDEVWGVQPAISNELSPGTWEFVNWEPDEIPGYVLGHPYGELVFNRGVSKVTSWGLH
jgi:hypothetical protein